VKPLTVYIASMFSDKDRVKQRAQELALLGIDCSSRWADEKVPHNVTLQQCTDEYLRETAVADLDDIIRAEKLVLTVPEDKLLVDATVAASSRGGRHFESGFIYGLIFMEPVSGTRRRELIILGKKENVFHYLDGEGVTKHYPAIKIFSTWDEVKQYLLEEKDVYEGNSDLKSIGK
jgi:hypothetical protein